MRKVSALFLIVVLAGAMAGIAAEKTMTGRISDSMCGASHKSMEHGKKKVDARECTLACIKGGAKYVFVSGTKVYEVSNQDLAALKDHAGHTVKLTGEWSADGKSVKVSKIEMPAAKKKAA
jgi:hypothetical protein